MGLIEIRKKAIGKIIFVLFLYKKGSLGFMKKNSLLDLYCYTNSKNKGGRYNLINLREGLCNY